MHTLLWHHTLCNFKCNDIELLPLYLGIPYWLKTPNLHCLSKSKSIWGLVYYIDLTLSIMDFYCSLVQDLCLGTDFEKFYKNFSKVSTCFLAPWKSPSTKKNDSCERKTFYIFPDAPQKLLIDQPCIPMVPLRHQTHYLNYTYIIHLCTSYTLK